jgi:hypothetical protein
MIESPPRRLPEIYEYIPESELGEDMEIEESNPQEPLVYIPITKGRAKLSPKERMALIAADLDEIESELTDFVAEPKEVS